MIGNPKYTKGTEVAFTFNNENKIGVIEIVDAFGTFGQSKEVSYDIFIESENMLYKHITESNITTYETEVRTNGKSR